MPDEGPNNIGYPDMTAHYLKVRVNYWTALVPNGMPGGVEGGLIIPLSDLRSMS